MKPDRPAFPTIEERLQRVEALLNIDSVKEEPKKSLAQELRDSWVGSGIGWSKLDADVKGDWERLAQRAKELILDVDKEKLAKLLRAIYNTVYSTDIEDAERVIDFFKSEASRL